MATLGRRAGMVLVALGTAALGLAGTAQAGGGYVADLKPLNGEKLGQSAKGKARLKVDDGQLVIRVKARGLAPGAMHLQHYHGFPDGKDAKCPTSGEDTNGDGYIDLIETEPVAGTTLVPFHDNPANLKIKSHSYPKADSKGRIKYKGTASIDELERALGEKHGVGDIDFDKRVVFLHGTAKKTQLPESVRSLPGVPAQVTLPVACGEIRPAK